MSKAENETATAIETFLIARGWIAWRQNNLAVKGRKFRGKKGISDVIALQPNGPAWFIEVKNP